MNLKEISRNLVLSLVSLLIFLLLLEGALRLGVSLFSERFTKVHPELGWYHVPGARALSETEGHTYQLGYNRHGFRLPEHDFQKPAGVFRIAVLGDSFVDGSEVGDEETFTWLLQKQVAGLEVINLGVYGFSTAQQLLTLEKVGLKFQPDLVIAVTMTNDYTDNLLNLSSFGARPRFVLENDSLVFQGTGHPAVRAVFRETHLPLPGREFFHRHSYLYYFLNQYIYQRLRAAKIQSIVASQKNALDESGQRQLYLRLIERMNEICEEAGSNFLVVFVYPQKNLLEQQQSPSAEVAGKLAGQGIAVLDLFEPLREEELQADASLYYREDFHWNPRGHQFVAAVLQEWVLSHTDRDPEVKVVKDRVKPDNEFGN